jgi:hypothetical protein
MYVKLNIELLLTSSKEMKKQKSLEDLEWDSQDLEIKSKGKAKLKVTINS